MFIKLEVLSTSFIDFLSDKFGELRSRSIYGTTPWILILLSALDSCLLCQTNVSRALGVFSFIRETIMRLVSEVGQEKKAIGQSQQAIHALTRERDSLQQKIREMEIEAERLKNQLTSSQDAWSATQQELDQRQAK